MTDWPFYLRAWKAPGFRFGVEVEVQPRERANFWAWLGPFVVSVGFQRRWRFDNPATSLYPSPPEGP